VKVQARLASRFVAHRYGEQQRLPLFFDYSADPRPVMDFNLAQINIYIFLFIVESSPNSSMSNFSLSFLVYQKS